MRGLTLIEVLVVLVLVALLAGAALPSYQGQVRRAARADAVEALTRLQSAQERHRNIHGWYAPRLAALGTSSVSTQGRYDISLVPLGAERYQARAEARGAQAADGECAVLTLDVDHGFARPGPDARCWNR